MIRAGGTPYSSGSRRQLRKHLKCAVIPAEAGILRSLGITLENIAGPEDDNKKTTTNVAF